MKIYHCSEPEGSPDYLEIVNEQDRISLEHTHEFTGSTRFGGKTVEHNHRYTALTDNGIAKDGSHVHKLGFETGRITHMHGFTATTGPAIKIDEKNHTHFVDGLTEYEDGHRHEVSGVMQVQQYTYKN